MGFLAAAALFLVIGVPVLMMVLQSGQCSGMPDPCRDDSPALAAALLAITALFVGTWWGVRKLVNDWVCDEDQP